MDIFVVKDNVATPNIEALLTPPFKTIWDRDNSKHKEVAIMEFSYIELLCSLKKSNPFAGYGEDVRAIKVIEAIFGDDEYDPDPLVLEAIEVYKRMVEEASPSVRVLRAVQKGAEKLIDFFEDFDLNERTNGGAAVLKPAEVTRALKEAHEVVLSVKKLTELVDQEISDSSKTRGNRDINYFEK